MFFHEWIVLIEWNSLMEQQKIAGVASASGMSDYTG